MGKFMLLLLVVIILLGYNVAQTGDPASFLIAALLTKLFIVCIPIAIVVWIF